VSYLKYLGESSDQPDEVLALIAAAQQHHAVTCTMVTPSDAFPLSTMGAMLSPVQTLDRIRQGQTARFKREFQDRIKGLNGATYELRLKAGKLDLSAWLDAFASQYPRHGSANRRHGPRSVQRFQQSARAAPRAAVMSWFAHASDNLIEPS
jgi:hypothetical protein